MIVFIGGMMLGGCLGVLVMALMVAARRAGDAGGSALRGATANDNLADLIKVIESRDAYKRDAEAMLPILNAAQQGLEEAGRENDRLNAIINTPHADEFWRSASIEAEHQRQRWGAEHDGGKTPADWFWLIGYLAGKALHAHAAGSTEKAENHIITTAAACANWHRAMFGKTDMRPGIEPPTGEVAA